MKHFTAPSSPPTQISRRSCSTGFPSLGGALLILLLWAPVAPAQTQFPQAPDLKKLSVEELMNIEVISVSKRPEKLSETASAIQIITAEEIRRAGATSIPEALRLATNLQVAQVNASQWAISSRGFNNVLANKLLVLIDGRAVYTPLYAGVFWDVQDTLLEDVDRIEVISGPGGTLWGSNAVNGVINIITKRTEDTQGLFLEGGAGTEVQALGGVRYGGKLSDSLRFRVYGKGFARDNTRLLNGAHAQDAWVLGQGGFRFDWEPPGRNQVTVQGDFYNARPNPDGTVAVESLGGNILGRWTHTTSERERFQLQIYYDRTRRNFGSGFTENLGTYDFDWQHRFQPRPNQTVVWGLDFRFMDHTVANLPLFAFLPAHKVLKLYSGFVQHETALFDNQLRLTVGSKFEHNVYSGFEYQPSGRIAWKPAKPLIVWGAVSRAVRTPSRIDRDFFLSAAPGIPLFQGGNFKAEELLSYEAGGRVQPTAKLSLSTAGFYNRYDNLRTAEPAPPPQNLPITIGNGLRGTSYGIEVSTVYQAADWWRLRGGYTFFQKDLKLKPASRDLNQASAESNDPKHQFLIQSCMSLPGKIELDSVIRYVSDLPRPRVANYLGLDVRMSWKATNFLEFTLAGQNLTDSPHLEFIPSSPSGRKIERNVYGKVTWRF